mgnify:CR=1 FL=1
MAEQKSPHLSKRLNIVRDKVNRAKNYSVDEALTLVKETATAKFDESVDVAVNLGVDAKKSDQTVRGSVVLPRGTGKKVRLAVLPQGDKPPLAAAAGADPVGLDAPATRLSDGLLAFAAPLAPRADPGHRRHVRAPGPRLRVLDLRAVELRSCRHPPDRRAAGDPAPGS